MTRIERLSNRVCIFCCGYVSLDLEATEQAAAAPHIESIDFQDVYRDPKRLGPGKKSLLFTLVLRSPTGTLTGDEADQTSHRVVEATGKAHGAQLRA